MPPSFSFFKSASARSLGSSPPNSNHNRSNSASGTANYPCSGLLLGMTPPTTPSSSNSSGRKPTLDMKAMFDCVNSSNNNNGDPNGNVCKCILPLPPQLPK